MKTQFITELPPHWQDTALIFEALGSPVRQRILLIFEAGEEITIKQVTELFSLSRTSIAFHLNALEKAGLLQRRAAGREVFYRLSTEPIEQALESVLKYIREEI